MAFETVRTLSSLVRLSHTIFGLPFALAAAALAHRAARAHEQAGLDTLRLLSILLAFTAARTAAMAFNRIVDARFDAENPRTANREIPRGAVSLRSAWGLVTLSVVVFLACAWLLGPLPLALAPACVIVVLGYSLLKRFTWSAHLFLGFALALAPGAAWVAVRGSFDGWYTPAFLMVAVATWVAGFDVIYSLQDEAFDRARGLYSIPARFGIGTALRISAVLHVGTVAALVGLHVHEHLGVLHFAGIAIVTAILFYEHWIVRPDDLTRVDKAFFDLNGYVSLVYLASILLDLSLA